MRQVDGTAKPANRDIEIVTARDLFMVPPLSGGVGEDALATSNPPQWPY
jgi:hypothetical protein